MVLVQHEVSQSRVADHAAGSECKPYVVNGTNSEVVWYVHRSTALKLDPHVSHWADDKGRTCTTCEDPGQDFAARHTFKEKANAKPRLKACHLTGYVLKCHTD